MTNTILKSLTVAAMLASAASPAMAQNIMGPGQITANASGTTIANGNGSYPLSEIADGSELDDGNNGFQGQDGQLGVIQFDLDSSYDIDQFFLWNDINVRAEGMERFTLTFLDANGNPIGAPEPLVAKPGRKPGPATSLSSYSPIDAVQIYRFNLRQGVKTVKLTVDSLHAQNNTYRSRVEIREVAFNGPAASPSTGAFRCYDLMSHRGKLERNTFNLTDQFGQTRTMIGHPVSLCNPVEVNKKGATVEAVKEQYKDHQVCYELLDLEGDRDRRVSVRTKDMLATNNLATGHADEICVVSTKEHVK